MCIPRIIRRLPQLRRFLMSTKVFKNVGVYDASNEKLTSKTFTKIIKKGGGGWKLTEDITVYITYTEDGVYDSYHLELAKGTWWDGASIPKLFTYLIGDPLDIEFALASCIHDYLYGVFYDRATSDKVFYQLLHATKFRDIPAWKEQAMYAAVRVGGQAYYASHSNPKGLIDKVGKSFWKLIKAIL
jgi:hypothetical protein